MTMWISTILDPPLFIKRHLCKTKGQRDNTKYLAIQVLSQPLASPVSLVAGWGVGMEGWGEGGEGQHLEDRKAFTSNPWILSVVQGYTSCPRKEQ